MSYADAAKRGPSQSPREARAPAPPQVVENDVSATTRYTDVDTPHVHSVPPTYSGETATQADRVEREARAAADKAERNVDKAESKGKRAAHQAESKASHAADKAKAKAGQTKDAVAKEWRDNKDNPVVLGNMVVWTVVAGALGVGAYRQHAAGRLDWTVAGTWAGIVGVFAAGDYFLSQYLFKNKYPRK